MTPPPDSKDTETKPAGDAGEGGPAENASATTAPASQTSEPAAWPPEEAAPADETREQQKPEQAAPASEPEKQEKQEKQVVPVLLAPTEAETAAAMPRHEMGFSDSTLHWLQDGEVSGPQHRPTGPVTIPSFDPRAPVAGRWRTYLVVGGAGIIALAIAGGLFVQAQLRRASAPAAPAVVDPARDLTGRAAVALAANRIAEALDLAHLALVADPRFADAHFVVASCERARNQLAAAREAYRKYLELAPLGTYSADARSALAALPP